MNTVNGKVRVSITLINVIAASVILKVSCSCVTNLAIIMTLVKPFVFDQKVVSCTPTFVTLQNGVVERSIYLVSNVTALTSLETIFLSFCRCLIYGVILGPFKFSILHATRESYRLRLCDFLVIVK